MLLVARVLERHRQCFPNSFGNLAGRKGRMSSSQTAERDKTHHVSVMTP